MERVTELSKKSGIPSWLLPAAGYLIAGASLIWVFSRFPYAQLGEHLRTMDWRWVALAMAIEILAYVIDAWRWKVLLNPVGAPPFGVCLQAVFTGIFANDVLPARAGEVVRCILLSYETKVRVPLALTSAFMLRIMDAIWLVLIYLAVTYRVSTHTAINRAMWAFGIGTLVISLILLWVLFHRQHAHNFANNRSWMARFVQLFEELHRLGHWREIGVAMAIGGLYWAAHIGAAWAIARSDSFYFGASEMAFLLVVKTIGTLIPGAPANMGTYQAITVYALERLFTEPNDAKILAEIMFGFLTLPLLVCGGIAVASAGLSFQELHRHAKGERRDEK
jgi:uncharacterized protein (TIRG00374 family)